MNRLLTNCRKKIFIVLLCCAAVAALPHRLQGAAVGITQKTGSDTLDKNFLHPPANTRPGVFWQWMGGLISKEGLTKDLEAMAAQGVGAVMVMQMPDQAPYSQRWNFSDFPGKVQVLSDAWFGLVNHAIGEADRLGITFSIFICPGWSHAGGPWVTPSRALKKLVSATVKVKGPLSFHQQLPRAPRSVGLGGGNDIPSWFRDSSIHKAKQQPEFYRDVAVVAIPSPEQNGAVSPGKIIDISTYMDREGILKWDAPAGEWTIIRWGVASENGVNHPAPPEATGLEADRMDPEAVRIVFDGMVGRIVREARAKGYHSFKAFETDSYEAGVQDFGLDFREQFKDRRGYDPVPWLSAWTDKEQVIHTKELTQRFRNDMTRTISELTAERFHGKLRSLADEHQVEWMIEPYFRWHLDWRTAGAQATLPGAEFWIGKPFGYIGPAPDIAALYGLPVVWAEAFTAESYNSAWRNDPQVLKPWGDAMFARGINQFYMHGFVHNPFGDHLQPGMTMGYWGTQFNRHLTWWPFSGPWHRYLSRCQYMLQQGRPVNDVLAYPARIQPVPGKMLEAGAFRQVALNDEALFDRLRVREDGRITVKGGGDFAAIALTPGMSLRPESLRKIRDLVFEGATLIGEAPPRESSSLENYPQCDAETAKLIDELWGKGPQNNLRETRLGKGKLITTKDFIGVLNTIANGPDLQFTGLSERDPVKLQGVPEIPFRMMEVQNLKEPSNQVNALSDDRFQSLDFTHRRMEDADLYFICNTSAQEIRVVADFRIDGRIPELWDPVSGDTRELTTWRQNKGRTRLPLQFAPQQSFFIVFRKTTDRQPSGTWQFERSAIRSVKDLPGPWDLSFDPKWGGPQAIVFKQLTDWSKHDQPGIRYYSGTAVYRKNFDMPSLAATSAKPLFIDLGKVHNLARVTLNGKELGVLWCAPWRIALPAELLKKNGNQLKVEVVNTWVNRLIGDEHEPEDYPSIDWNPDNNRKGSYDIAVGSKGLKDLPDWLINGQQRPSKGRFTFSSWIFYNKDAPLQPSGLLGPVKIITVSGK